ncbi:2-dehydro-3-deoxyphosphogluconate aldolase / (4S)-4-hydroxy-2-oxoglutarate aldolase [Pedobacter sp. ok626]|uniref:bifunctional 4-hydroxy-2-oxoglutarate aldolase/2-dehydro-3-deoxy-phosphogluconate aldolase n=1 Tax=Pedobacter sp. ok626 TaxID=1761882 RepID=UPI00088F8D88|nr:bifunctional 4-hydroxy-2-oxoglutarate aldolase/2-dehydro-3-deoxy-phosphogluconate aldolase [Pedobacter sp. ok626]SDK50555.1 2-dehydro-3-deoxyphosphogluconate aldolase / (4S)-4-hydroxy-2-oxoglutarate aldolase [Pedobacter sp. ok626]
MKTETNPLKVIQDYPVIPVYYNEDAQTCIEVVKASYAGGIRVFEFTNRGPKAPENFKALLAYRNEHFPDMKLGIGTIKTVAQAEAYIELGADFIVSPIVRADLAEITASHNILWVPGCMTPTEINLAEELGAPLVKLFPGDTLGIGFLKAIKPLFPNLKFMPTGGVDVNKENIDNWLNAGVTALGFGSKLFQQPENAKDYNWLTERCQLLIKLVKG